MKRSTITTKPLKSSFLSCEKDAETIIRKLFVESRPYSDQLKRLLVINTKDCLDTSNESYNKIVANTSIKDLFEENYITLIPKIKIKEHGEVKSYIVLTFDNFVETSNPEYRDCTISISILSHMDAWDIGDFQLRPVKIMGLIDSILNNCKLSGIGELQFLGTGEISVSEDISGYSMLYLATHGQDDTLPNEDEIDE